MADLKKYLVLDGPIQGDNEVKYIGDVIELDAKCAKRLLAEKKVEPFKKQNSKEE
jgi:hypothetical protein